MSKRSASQPRTCQTSGCYLQQLRVLPAELLQQSWEQGGVSLDGLSHVHELGLGSQERQRVLSWPQTRGQKCVSDLRLLRLTGEAARY